MKNSKFIENSIRVAVRKLLSEAKVTSPVPLEVGIKLFNDMKATAVKGNVANDLMKVSKLAIKRLKDGDRADQKFADNLRAYVASIRSGRSQWVIAELAFAEWERRRRANPVVQAPSQPDGPTSSGIGETRKTELESIYESVVDFASRSGREPFEVLDDMMAVAEKQALPDHPGGQETAPVKVSSVVTGACDSCGAEPGCNIDCVTCMDVGGFEHNDIRINNPLYDPAGKTEVDPNDCYGDAFMKSSFPFVHGDHFIVDPRYNETGDCAVDPVKYYGDSLKRSAYASVFKEGRERRWNGALPTNRKKGKK